MNMKENARPRLQPEAGQCGAERNQADCVPYFDYTTDITRRQDIRDFLGQGKDNAVTGRKLMEIFGVRDLRSVSKAVELARRSGVPICATTSPDGPGYFVAATTSELSGYLRSLDHRLHEIRTTRTSLEACLVSMEGQCVIGGWADE